MSWGGGPKVQDQVTRTCCAEPTWRPQPNHLFSDVPPSGASLVRLGRGSFIGLAETTSPYRHVLPSPLAMARLYIQPNRTRHHGSSKVTRLQTHSMGRRRYIYIYIYRGPIYTGALCIAALYVERLHRRPIYRVPVCRGPICEGRIQQERYIYGPYMSGPYIYRGPLYRRASTNADANLGVW